MNMFAKRIHLQDKIAEAKATERARREMVREMLKGIIASYPVEQQDEVRLVFKDNLDALAAADARDDAVAAEVLADVEIGG